MESKSIVSMTLFILVVSVLPMTPYIFAPTHTIEDEIGDIIVDETGELISKIVKDIDFGDENFLNATESETERMQESGLDVLRKSFELAFSVKELASAGVEFASPYPISPFIATIVGIAFAGLFLLSILKKVAKHILIMMVIGIGIVMVFVVMNIQT